MTEAPVVAFRTYRLTGPDGRPYDSFVRGRFGGHHRGRRYGRLDCRAALRAIARGGYLGDRRFFADEATAIAAGYRPCATCLPETYARWKAAGGPISRRRRGSPTRPRRPAR